MAQHPFYFQLQPDSHAHGPYVSTPNGDDIMLGRGVSITNWPGNVRFRELIGTWKVEYTQTGRHHTKKVISERIYQEILRRGGRFLRQIDSTVEAQGIGVPVGAKAWVIVDERVAIRKIKQALREYPAVKLSKRSNEARLSDVGEEVSRALPTAVSATSNMVPHNLPAGGMRTTDVDPLDTKMPQQHSLQCSPDRVEGIKKSCSPLQNTVMAAAMTFYGPQMPHAEDSNYQPTQQSAVHKDTKNIRTSADFTSAAFERSLLSLDQVGQSYSLKQSLHPQRVSLIGHSSGPTGSLSAPAAPHEPLEFHRRELDGGHHSHRNGPTINSTTHPMENLDDSLRSLRTIEEIRASGAAELDESVASFLSILSHPAKHS
jgi:hypothetical protein